MACDPRCLLKLGRLTFIFMKVAHRNWATILEKIVPHFARLLRLSRIWKPHDTINWQIENLIPRALVDFIF